MRNNSFNFFELAKESMSSVDFGDKRLNKRGVSIAVDFLKNPFTTPPKILKKPKKIKAFYRFMNSDKVNHSLLIGSHTKSTISKMSNHNIILCIQDSTPLIFNNKNYEIEGLYDMGGNHTQGLQVHNTISVIPHENYGIIDGLAHQIILDRRPKDQRSKEDNEIRLWTDSITKIGLPPKNTTIIDICDRGADALEVMDHSITCCHEFIIRAQHDRKMKNKERLSLFELARSSPTIGQTRIKVQASVGRRKRDAKLNISFSKVTLPPTKKHRDIKPLSCTVIHVHEIDTPDKQKSIEWFLLTSLDIDNLDDALQAIKYYSYRMIVEEYHKCMKTGFKIKDTQLKTRDRIETLLGFISISSVKLLQMRDMVRIRPNEDVSNYVDEEDVEIVSAFYEVPKESIMTVDKFLRHIAMMGGFMNRKSDGNPGWQSIWEGWKYFLSLKKGFQLQKKLQGTYG